MYTASLYCFVYCYSFLHSCLFPNFAQVYRTLLPSGSPVVINTYHIHTRNLSHTVAFRTVLRGNEKRRKRTLWLVAAIKVTLTSSKKKACINQQIPRTDMHNWVNVIACLVLLNYCTSPFASSGHGIEPDAMWKNSQNNTRGCFAEAVT